MLQGDERAFRTFFDSYFPRLYRFALPRVGGEQDLAKDVVQAALTKAVRNLKDFRGDAALFSWLSQICRNQIVDALRERKRRSDNVVLIEDMPELRAVFDSIAAPTDQEPHQRYTEAETKRLVQTVLDRLPARYGDILEWKYIEGWSVEEIGSKLGVGHTAAQSLLARARTAFRESLEVVFGQTAKDVLANLNAGGRHE